MNNRLIYTLEGLSAAIGAAICLYGAWIFAVQQSVLSGELWDAALWPLPGLVLLQWGLLGAAVLVGVLAGRPGTLTIAWAACGALVALAVLGAFSIGPTVLLALIFLLAAVLASSLRRARNLFRDVGVLILGTLVNFALFALLILLERLT